MFEKFESPFVHFFAEGCSVPDDVAVELQSIAEENNTCFGTATGSRADYGNRAFIKRTDGSRYSREIMQYFEYINSSEGRRAVGDQFDVELLGADLRIELVSDVNGFFQVPHLDTKDKRITWLTYLGDVAENGEVGTDLYSNESQFYKSAPWGFNNGLVFRPSENSWHGFTKGKVIQGIRKVLIINFVDDWNDKHELFDNFE